MESTTYTVDGKEFELQHYGVKGMKWGVRKRYLNADGSLNDRGIKKYARKGYAQDSFRSNKTVGGKIWDAYTGAHKIMGNAVYDTSSKKQNRERAERYLSDKQKKTAVKAKKKGKTAVDRSLKTVGGNTVANAARTNQYLSGMRAVQSLLNGNPYGAAYYSGQSKLYRDTKEFWK